MTFRISFFAALFILTSAFLSTFAQGALAQSPDPAAAVVSDPLGRTTPRGTVLGFLDAMATDDVATASQFLGLLYIAASKRVDGGDKLSRDLQTVLTRSGRLLQTVQIANNPGGHASDGLAADSDVAGAIGPASRPTDFLLEKKQDADGLAVWLICSTTLKRIPYLLNVSSETLIHQWLPDTLNNRKLTGVPASDWLAMAVIGVVMLVLAYLLSAVVVAIAAKLLTRNRVENARDILRPVRLPLAVIIASKGFQKIAVDLGVSVIGRELVGRFIFIISTIAIMWLLWHVVDGISSSGAVQNDLSWQGGINLGDQALPAPPKLSCSFWGFCQFSILSTLMSRPVLPRLGSVAWRL